MSQARRLLMVAFHFPPVRGSSGLQRTLSFARYLPAHQWQPVVLSASPRAYPDTGVDQMGDIASDLVVRRAFALDTARHLSLGGRYPGFLALPDRWVTWCLGAVPAGLLMIARERPDAIWTTYPIATAHLIGLVLHRISGLPWIADFRDSMTEVDYPRNPTTRRVYRWIERQTIKHCARAVFTADQARSMYAGRYPQVPDVCWSVIENGYDERAFEGASAAPAPTAGRPLKLLHSGVLYPNERDPTALFDALAALKQAHRLGSSDVQLVLRSSGHDAFLKQMIDERRIADLVKLEPALAYRDALEEMMAADGLLILQSQECNHQIPAKLYEYLRARRPVLALTHGSGDTAAVLRRAGIDTIADLKDREAIAGALVAFLDGVRAGSAPVASAQAVAGADRAARTGELAALADAVVAA